MLPVPFENVKTRAAHVQSGDWFLPLGPEGEPLYHEIPEALARGALGYSYDRNFLVPAARPETSLPADSLPDLLRSLAVQKRRHCTGLFVGVAGSSGKAAVKEMVAAAAGVWASADPSRFFFSGNEHECLPSQLLRMPRHSPFALFELSPSSLPLLAPQVVALLDLPEGDLASAASALDGAEILLVPHGDSEIGGLAIKRSKKKALSFGESPDASYFAQRGADGRVAVSGEGTKILVSSGPASGRLSHFAAAAALCRVLGFPWPAIQAGLERHA